MRENVQRFDPRQVMSRPDFEVFYYREPKPGNVEVHHHDFYEVYFFLNGQVEYWVEGRFYRLEPGDLLLISPMELHRPTVREGGLYERIVLWVDRAWLEKLSAGGDSLSRCFDHALSTHTNLLRPSAGQRAAIRSRLAELVQESYGDGGYAGAQYATGVLLQFLAELNRMALHTDEQQRTDEPETLVSRVLAYVGTHYSEELSLETLAQNFYVSKYHLSHEFSRAVGIGVHRYIMLKRLQVARQLLAEGMAPGEVCIACGFRDYTNFYRAFRAEYGTGPRGFAGE
ncbi:MAG: helix-turn-helix domain-containing protein [Oscillospiraceae bacterium]|nr:helix-turn-helix domain-containing protein [Oscillospiraceae bacterium]